MSSTDPAEIRDFIANALREAGYTEAIGDETELHFDVGLNGIDADEFLNAVAKKFRTRFEGFRFIDYFPGEGEMTAWMTKRNSFTVGHLVHVVERGSWFPPLGPHVRVLEDADHPPSPSADAWKFWLRVMAIVVVIVIGLLIIQS